MNQSSKEKLIRPDQTIESADSIKRAGRTEELWAVVPAAGSGTRLSSTQPKQYLRLNDRCILQRTIDTLLDVDNIKGIVVVLSENDTLWNDLPASSHPQVMTTLGGNTRAKSVIAGLEKVSRESRNDNAMVLVHDAARALTAVSDISRLVTRVMRAPEHGGLLATKVQDTLKRANPDSVAEKVHAKIKSTVCRDGLWNAQTPQMFRVQLLHDALVRSADAVASGDITDEACAMEKAGYTPVLVEALCPNFKITHTRDLDMARALVELSERCA